VEFLDLSGIVSVPAMDKATFVSRFGGIFEHSPWVAEAAFDAGLPPEPWTAVALHAAMIGAMRAAPEDAQDRLIKAHPDLAGKLAAAHLLTADSTSEQASAGLDQLTEAEKARFTALNDAYQARFGFPFIVAVRGLTKADIIARFEARIANSRADERAEALGQIARITLLRLQAMLP
jgi:OHCU decarboxylase